MVFFLNHGYHQSKCSSLVNMLMEINNEIIEMVWNMGTIVAGVDSSMFRKDYAGAMMMREAYGNRNHSMGWEIDHLVPKSKGGTDDIDNLMPIQWENNLAKSDSFPIWHSSVTFKNEGNIYEPLTWLAVKTAKGFRLLSSKV